MFFSAPCHLYCNRKVNCFVQTYKTAMKTVKGDKISLNQKITSFLLSYQTRPHSVVL